MLNFLVAGSDEYAEIIMKAEMRQKAEELYEYLLLKDRFLAGQMAGIITILRQTND